jgi:hypothetical protein
MDRCNYKPITIYGEDNKMPKIVVKDMDGEIQVFKGPGLKFFENARGVDIFDMDRANDGPGAGKIAHLKNYQWVKAEDDKQERSRPEPSRPERHDPVDRYTEKELEGRDPHDTPDFNMLRKDTPRAEVMGADVMQGYKVEPKTAGEVLARATPFGALLGAAMMVEDAENPPAPEKEPEPAAEKPDPLAPEGDSFSLDDLVGAGLLKKGTADIISKNAEAKKPPEKEPEKPATPEKKKRIRPSRAKPKPAVEKEAPAIDPAAHNQLMDQLGAPEAWKAPALVDDGHGGAIVDNSEGEADPMAAIREAEARHQKRQACRTCKGAGLVPDPESQDPLDTIICPHC